MTRTTIDFGIDLGTTNSAVAVINRLGAEIIKNNDDRDITPSAVWIDERNRLLVGMDARERHESDPQNAFLEFKLRMGTDEPVTFASSGRSMLPEQLSAEVLKSLRGDVRQRLGEEISAAVVTVPAAFDTAACEATRRAAQLAGLQLAPLILEPTAAALAYGFQATDENAHWLVYDFGGGTFDAAVVRIRDGEFSVINHAGDNYLGGKLIDWGIVEELLIPAVIHEYGFTDLSRGNPKWRSLIAALKINAERAKVRLSRTESQRVKVSLENLHGNRFDFEYELRRADVERLTEPYLVRSLNLCKRALSEAGLAPGDIAKVILVGGPTLAPYFRERLASPTEGLGIPVDSSRDPMTVVACGAAIFAGTQRLPEEPMLVPVGSYSVELQYPQAGPDPDPLIGGRLSGPGGANAGDLFVELINSESRPPWRSGQIPVGADGVFRANLWAEPGRNTFHLELTDGSGIQHPVTPNRLTYTCGVLETDPTVIHSIGVGLSRNDMVWLMTKGTPLPARRRVGLRTAVPLRAGESGGMIRIPILEGEHTRADRNRRIGQLEVIASQVRQDLPEGTEVELTIETDTSRNILARAYVPLLQLDVEQPISLVKGIPTFEELTRDADTQRQRLDMIMTRQAQVRSPEAARLLDRLGSEQIVEEVGNLVRTARTDKDSADTASKRLLDLKSSIDDIEDALLWPEQVREVQELVDTVRAMATQHGNQNDWQILAEHERAIHDAIDAGATDLLKQRAEELGQFAARLLQRQGVFQPMLFEHHRQRQAEMADQYRASRLIAEGNRAVSAGDQNKLREINIQLAAMLPDDMQGPMRISDVRRG